MQAQTMEETPLGLIGFAGVRPRIVKASPLHPQAPKAFAARGARGIFGLWDAGPPGLFLVVSQLAETRMSFFANPKTTLSV